MNKKRLLKDLPFKIANKAGTVLTKANGGYHIDRGDTIYKEGGASHNGWIELDAAEVELVNFIWDNTEWFEYAITPHLSMSVHKDRIEIGFEPLDLGQAQTLAKRIKDLLIKFSNEYSDYNFTVSLK